MLPYGKCSRATSPVWFIWFVLFIWLIWFIGVASLSQTNQANQTDQMNEQGRQALFNVPASVPAEWRIGQTAPPKGSGYWPGRWNPYGEDSR